MLGKERWFLSSGIILVYALRQKLEASLPQGI
jgi:hypothetical protein